MKKINFLVVFLAILFCFSVKSASAVDLIIEEGKVRLSVAPESSKTGLIHIKNISSEPISVRAYLEDWYYLPGADGTKEFKPAGAMPLSCAAWISFSPAEFTLPPFGSQVINYIVKVPKNVVGGHYAVLFFETMLPKPIVEEGVGVAVAARLGSLFYVEPEGTIKREISIKDFSVEKPQEDLPLTLNLGFKNSGNVDITATGSYDLIDKTGMVYARGKFNDVFTFPGDSAVLKGYWKEPIAQGKYDLIITLDLGKALQESGMGRGPTVVKEAAIEIGPAGTVLSVSTLK